MGQPNPYRPGGGQAPGVLAGRGDILDAAAEALDVGGRDRRTPPPLVLVGADGVGKSVVLGAIATMAADHYGWPAVHVEVGAEAALTDQVVDGLAAAQEVLEEPVPGSPAELQALAARLGALDKRPDVGRRPDGSEPAAMAVERALTATCEAAAARSSGVLLAIDDLHLAPTADLAALVVPLHQHVFDGWPLVVVVTALPTTARPWESVPYLERGEWRELGLLTHDDAVVALRGPAASAGRPLSATGAALLARASGGHPLAVQRLGFHAWNVSPGAAAITVEDATAAIPPDDVELLEGLYACLWEHASVEDQAYLAAVAHLAEGGDAVTNDAVAAHLGQAPTALSDLCDRLVGRGTLVADGAALRLPLPGMAGWINAR